MANQTSAAPADGRAQGEAALVHRPAAGAVSIVETTPGGPLKFDFASTDAKFTLLDVDLVIIFPDGGKILLPGYAVGMMAEEAAPVAFSDKTLDAQALLAQIQDMRLLSDDDGLPTMGSSAATTGDKAKDEGQGQAEAASDAPPPPPPAPVSDKTGTADFDKPPVDAGEDSLPVAPAAPASSSSSSPPSSPNRNTGIGNGNGDGNILAAKLAIELLGVSGDKVSPSVAGGEIIRGAASVVAATTDPSFAVQQQTKSLTGTDGDDVIYVADPKQMPSGTFERLIDIRVTFPIPNVVAQSATITSLPTGFAVNNATAQGSNYVVQFDPTDPNHLQLQLVYTLPAAGAVPSADGVFSSFTLSLLLSGLVGSAARQFSGTQTFVIKDIFSADDVMSGGGTGGDATIYALNANPPGTHVSAGGGNDTIYAGPGADTLDGGAGDNLVSYAYSSSGVAVNLQTGVGKGGYAQGDVVSNFDQIEGSPYDDFLIGRSAGYDTFFASAGADTYQGAGPGDTVDYSRSVAGVSVDLEAGTGSGGLAAGNQLIGIANVIGSATGANALYGTSGANILTGGAGDDTIDGRGGADVISAGAGDDRVSYYGTEISIDGGAGANTLVLRTAVNVDLTAADEVAGPSLVTNFESVDASALTTGITLTGTAGANTLVGGAGADTIDGGGGADAIRAGAGDDHVAYYGTEISIDGGAGVNTLVVLTSTASINLSSSTNQSSGSTIVTNFQEVTAATISAALSITGSTGANTIVGSSGADTIDGYGGADSILGGAADDTIHFHGAEAGVNAAGGTANLLVMDASGGATAINLSVSAGLSVLTGASTVVANFQSVNASALSDALTITGSTGANTITGSSGSDTIDGNGGADSITGGAADDQIAYHGAETGINAGGGLQNLLIMSASGGTTAINLSVAAGSDETTGDSTVVANIQSVNASALSNILTITGSTGANTITGSAGADTIDGDGGADSLTGGSASDTIHFHGAEIGINAGGGTANLLVMDASGGATAVNLSVAANANELTGVSAIIANFQSVNASALTNALTITGSTGANTITGSAGADTIDGNGGADSIIGGSADDKIHFHGTETGVNAGGGTANLLVMDASGAATAVNLSVSAGTNELTGPSAVVANFQSVDASALASALTITGSTGANTIFGAAGASTIDGDGGADSILGGLGDDKIYYRGAETEIDGGGGTANKFVMAASGGTTSINLSVASGSDETTGDATFVTNFQNVNASLVSNALSITGSAGANTITGSAGANTIDGGGGADAITGGAGDDQIAHHGAESSLNAGGGLQNLLVFAASGGTTAINLSVASGNDETSGDAVAVSNFQSVDAHALSNGVTITGSTGANTILGSAAGSTIDGGGGADSILGGSGDDTISYHGAEAYLIGGGGKDTLVLAAATTVNLGSADQTSGDSTIVSGFVNVYASALTTAVSLTGSSAANVIHGGSGNDTITGGGGADTLIGGTGSDVFMLDASSINLGLHASGASNSNTADITGSGSVTDVQLAASLTHIQNIDFSGGSVSAHLSFTGSQIAGIDGAATNTLTITTNASVSVAVADAAANVVTLTNGATTSYTIYDDSHHDNILAHLAIVA